MKKELLILKHPKTIIALTILVLVICIVPLGKMQINSDLLTYLPEHLPAMQNKQKVENLFGTSDPVIIVFESDDVLNDSTLQRIKSLSRAFNRMNDFDMVLSLFDTKSIKGENGTMVVDPAVRYLPRNEKQREELRTELKQNELAYNLVVSDDFKYTLIILNSISDKDDDSLMQLIIETVDQFPGSEKVSINGQPFLRNEAKNNIARDFSILLPIGLLVMCIFLWISFREKRGVLLPTFVVLVSVLLSMAFIPVFGWELSIIAIIIPVMMIAVANDYGIHVITKYQELNAENPEMCKREIVQKTVQYMRRPVVLTGVTTIMGLLGLLTHVMLPAKQMGVVSTLGIAFALLASLTFIPAALLRMKKGKAHQSFLKNGKKGFIDHILLFSANTIIKHPKSIIITFAILLTISGLGISRLEVASDFDEILPQEHSYNVSLKILNRHFSGTKNVNVLFHGDIKDPALLKRMIKYEQEIDKIPGVGSVNSIASMIKIMSRAINQPGDTFYDQIPQTRNAVAQYLELYAMSGDPGDLDDFVDNDYQHAVMQIQFYANTLDSANYIIREIIDLVKIDQNFSVTGGMGLVENKLCNSIATGQITSLVAAFIAILLLLLVIFRSFSAGLLGSLPLFFSIITTFGIMGWTGIKLDIITALLSSVSIGLGIDYTIHIFWRMKSELKKGHSYVEAIKISLTKTGRGITINAFSVLIGFSVLFLSGFPLIHLFAFLIILSIVLCLISALLLIPAISLVVKPKFLLK